jgi:hypothetical protein
MGRRIGSLLFHFFLFFLVSAELAAGPLARAVLTAVVAFSLGVAQRANVLSCVGDASVMGWSEGGAILCCVLYQWAATYILGLGSFHLCVVLTYFCARPVAFCSVQGGAYAHWTVTPAICSGSWRF